MMKNITKDEYRKIKSIKEEKNDLEEQIKNLSYEVESILIKQENVSWSDIGLMSDYFDDNSMSLDELLEKLDIRVEEGK
jgi:SpoVK/Ycf46/Vps4 family AAA+-type ATPase